MKKVTLALFLIFGLNQISTAQITFMSGLNDPNAVAFYGDTLYFSDQSTGEIFKVVDLQNPSANVLASGLTDPYEMKVLGNELYISQSTGVIVKLDLDDMTPTIDTVVIAAGQTTGIAFKDSVMYYSNITTQLVMTLDLTNGSAMPEAFIDGHFGIGMAFDADTLYICSAMNNAITKHDCTDSTTASTPITIATGLSFPAGGAIIGDQFYFTETNSDAVSRVGMNPPYVYNQLFFGSTPRRLAAHGSDIYVAMALGSSIMKYGHFTSFDEQIVLDFEVYPNPSNGIFTVQFANEVSNWNIKLRNELGQEVLNINNAVSNSIEVNLNDLPSGIYFVEVKTAESISMKKVIIQH